VTFDRGVGSSKFGRKFGPWIALLLSAAFFLQGMFGALEKSLTWDEPFHIAGGYAILTRGEFDLFGASPPLMQQLEALPLLSLDLAMPAVDDPRWRNSMNPAVAFGKLFLYKMGNDVDQIAFRARLPVLMIGAALVFGIYAVARRSYGELPALSAAALAATSPNLLAHAKVATADLGCSAAMFAAVWAFDRACDRARTENRTRDWILCGAVTGIALLTKYTALLLGPIFITLGLWRWWRQRQEPDSMTAKALLRAAMWATAAMAVVIAVDFGSLDLRQYLRGVQKIYACHYSSYSYYLLGSVSDSPWWYYHFVAFALKVPVSTQLLLACALGSLILDRKRLDAAITALVPAFAVFAVACFDEENIGLRRVLPAFPFLFLFCAQALRAAALAPLVPRAALALAVTLVVWSAAAGLGSYPHHLSYFNAAAGGPERGPFLLDESNIDWGQDLPALASWQRGRPPTERVKLYYFGSAKPSAYGVRSESFNELDRISPQPGVYAMSVHRLVGMRKGAAHGYPADDWLTQYTPIARAGHSIYIYEF